VAAVCGLVVFLEIIQFYLPKRVCDWRDTVAGCTGAAMAWGIYQLKSRNWESRKQKSNLKPET
jgi:glycopeptide antibiotics resistance protein